MRFHTDPLYGKWTSDTSVVSVGATRRFVFREATDSTSRYRYVGAVHWSAPRTAVISTRHYFSMYQFVQSSNSREQGNFTSESSTFGRLQALGEGVVPVAFTGWLDFVDTEDHCTFTVHLLCD